MGVSASKVTIRTLQVGELEIPSGLVSAIICQFRLVSEKNRHFVQSYVDSIWGRLKNIGELSCHVKALLNIPGKSLEFMVILKIRSSFFM